MELLFGLAILALMARAQQPGGGVNVTMAQPRGPLSAGELPATAVDVAAAGGSLPTAGPLVSQPRIRLQPARPVASPAPPGAPGSAFVPTRRAGGFHGSPGGSITVSQWGSSPGGGPALYY